MRRRPFALAAATMLSIINVMKAGSSVYARERPTKALEAVGTSVYCGRGPRPRLIVHRIVADSRAGDLVEAPEKCMKFVHSESGEI